MAPDLPAARPASRPTSGVQVIRRLGLAAATLLAIATLILTYGFNEPPVSAGLRSLLGVLAVAGFVAMRLLVWLTDQPPGERTDLVIAGYAVAALLADAAGLLGDRAVAATAILDAYLLFMVGLVLLRANRRATEWGARSPARLLVGGFVTLSLVGAALLFLPVSTINANYARNYVHDHIINCLFNATSAVCVTGLSVADIGSTYTFTGQAIVLLLIQVGGLSITIFGAVAGLLLGQALSLRGTAALGDVAGERQVGDVLEVARFVVISTVVIELIGAALLLSLWPAEWPFARKMWYSVFHSVSAFCNAGFGLYKDSLIGFSGAWQVHLVIAPLIVLGGLGFPVLAAIWGWMQSGWQRRVGGSDSALGSVLAGRLDLHANLVLTTSVVLILGGGLALFATETLREAGQQRINRGVTEADVAARANPDRLDNQPPAQRLANCLFQSITARTAGFNTVSLAEGDISPAGQMVLNVLMFIGGSPASTAGGVKTTVLAVLVLAVLATLRNREQVEVQQRRLPASVIRQAGAVFILYLAFVVAVVVAMLMTQRESFGALVFESVSACGTVGLSTGITPQLSPTGKLILIVAMLGGRIGPLTVLLALPRQQRKGHYEYAQESVVLG